MSHRVFLGIPGGRVLNAPVACGVPTFTNARGCELLTLFRS